MLERSLQEHREAPPSSLTLTARDVHVLAVRLDLADWRGHLGPEVLSEDERQRAERLRFERERRRFVVCRAALRTILGSYLERPPSELSFRTGAHGKPRLAPGEDIAPIHFNVSHSDELALVAVSRERELGVDIERVRPLDGMEDIVARHFGPAEQQAFGRLAPAARQSMFYRHWTLKEAYLKAAGVGMSREPADIDVSGAGDHPLWLPDLFGKNDEHGWHARTLDPGPEYAAALVVEGRESMFVTKMIQWVATPLTLADAAHTVMATTHG